MSQDPRKWLIENRVISEELLSAMGIKDLVHPKIGRAIAFPYRRGGKTYAAKIRSVDKRFTSTNGVSRGVYNEDCLRGDETLPVVITEGEIDCLSVIEAGFVRAISVPNGWTEQGNSVEALVEVEDLLRKSPYVIVAGDSDRAGESMPRAVANLLKGHDVRYAVWPDGCKDPNDVLVRYGAGELTARLNAAQRIDPPGGLITAISDLPPISERRVLRMDLAPFDRVVAFELGAISVWTGVPGSGKSTFLLWAAGRVAALERIRVGLFAFESHPHAIRDQLCRNRSGKPWDGLDQITRQRVVEGLDKRFRIVHRTYDDGTAHRMGWLETMIETLAIRDGCKLIVVDPWNELEHLPEPGETMTSYINWATQRLRQIAERLEVHIAVVAHPKKLPDSHKAPTGYDVADCHDAATEVLTGSGWKPHSEVTEDDLVACFDLETGGLKYDHPTEVIRSTYRGQMHLYEGQRYSACVTPNHRMVLMPNWPEPKGGDGKTGRPRVWEKGVWRFVHSSEVPSAEFKIPGAALLEDQREAPPELIYRAKFLGYWLAEGWKQSSGIALCQNEGRVHDEIIGTMDALGLTYSQRQQTYEEREKAYAPTTKWYVGRRANSELVDWVRGCGDGCDSKVIPPEAMAWPLPAKAALLAAYIDGDGTHYPSGRAAISTTSKELADQVMIISTELGRSTTISERKWPDGSKNRRAWVVTIGAEDRPDATMCIRRNRRMVDYDGPIYCLRVPSGAYVTRRDGKVQITGNSAAFFNKPSLGVTVHQREDEDGTPYVELSVWKVRSVQLYRFGKGKVRAGFDPRTMDYSRYASASEPVSS